ncbi:MAG: hypothetical protein WC752_00640 [Patescibacteria group bacterium]
MSFLFLVHAKKNKIKEKYRRMKEAVGETVTDEQVEEYYQNLLHQIEELKKKENAELDEEPITDEVLREK